jgi:hypothetical protein
MVKCLVPPGVKKGLQVTVDAELLQVTMAPGYCVLSDGFVVGETEPVVIPIFEPGFGDYSLTLIAKRIVEPGMVNDVVTYEIIEGVHGADTLATIPNLVRLPLAWIYKKGSSFEVINLGDMEIVESFRVPFPELYSNSDLNIGIERVNGVAVGPQYRSFSNVDNTLYLTIPPGEAISSIEFIGKSSSSQNMYITSLNAMSSVGIPLGTTLNFGDSATYTSKKFEYPFKTYLFEDILEISFSSSVPFLLSQIRVHRSKIFG